MNRKDANGIWQYQYPTITDKRIQWLTTRKPEIDALPALSCAPIIGKWYYWIKAFALAGIDPRLVRIMLRHHATPSYAIRAELADYIRRNCPDELRSASATRARNARPQAIRDHNRMIKEIDEIHNR